jgi:methionyl-tRNA synthetase
MGYLSELFAQFSAQLGIAIWILVVIVIWSIVWKLIALWKAARKHHVVWFIVLALVNTVGILEILYFYIFSEMKHNNFRKKKDKKRKKLTK